MRLGSRMPLAGALSNRHEGGNRESSDNEFLVGVIGALLNHADSLVRLTELRARLLSQAAGSSQPAVQLRPRCGAIQDAVIHVLGTAEAPMSVGDVHAAVERHLSMRVSKDSVNSCLSVGARGADALFERTGRGVYRLQPETRRARQGRGRSQEA
jgi:hypothetical protein